VVERSVTIAGISTKELVTKDFATEPNEETLRQAAHRMAQKLAGSLALVTCKEPLRSNLSSHMRQFLNEQGFTEVFTLMSLLRPILISTANGTRPSCTATCPG
jgi:CCR4-NOT transcription complex subunit 1